MSSVLPRSRPPLILIGNDQEWSARSLESVLAPQGYAVLLAYTGARAVELALTANPDAVILDYALPDISGVDVCRRLRANSQFPPIVPVIITTADADYRQQRLEAYRAGAWDFCTQPLDVDILLPKLKVFTDAKQAADRMQGESLIDSETGLYSVKGLARRAREIGSDAVRRNDALACIAFSLELASRERDGEVDSAASEALAQHVGAVCRRATRASDAVGRLAHNEYAILAAGASEAGAAIIADRLKDLFEAEAVRIDGVQRSLRVHPVIKGVENLSDVAGDSLQLLHSVTRKLRHGEGLAGQSTDAWQTALEVSRRSRAGTREAP